MYINPSDKIQLSNVVSQKYKCDVNKLSEVLEGFLKCVYSNKLVPKGLCIYSITNVPLDKVIEGEIYISVKNELIDNLKDLDYHTYFCIENMISTCIYEKFEEKTEEAYFILLKYIEEKKLQQITPIFIEVAGDKKLPYAFAKVGVLQTEEN